MLRFSHADIEENVFSGTCPSVHKEECMYSFDTPFSLEGIYVCLRCCLCFGRDHMDLHWEKTSHSLYLNIKTVKKLKPTEATSTAARPTVLGIGVDGGFATEGEQYEFDTTTAIVRLPTGSALPLPNLELPDKLQVAIAAILAAESAEKNEQIKAWVADDQVQPSKFAANLPQLNNGVVVPPTGWRCQHPGCTFTSNLWLNLSDGGIHCGRSNNLGLGNGHAADHYSSTHYPLAVKIGTLTAESAEVYSYAEDTMVLDPLLDKHLQHFGLDRRSLTKTDKTLAELELDQNEKFEWSKITESDKPLVPVFGPGLTGLKNLGNSCYLSSVMQILFTIPHFQHRYSLIADRIWKEAPADPSNDFACQMAKLGRAMLSGRYSVPSLPPKSATSGTTAAAPSPAPKPGTLQDGIPPRSLKAVVGRENREFSTNHQQDALELMQLLLQMVERSDRPKKLGDPSKALQFDFEERLECSQSHTVRYTYRNDNVLSCSIPVEAAVNVEEFRQYEKALKQWKQDKQLYEQQKNLLKALVDAAAASGSVNIPATTEIPLPPQPTPVRAIVKFESVLERLVAPEVIDGFYSTAIDARTAANKTVRLASFPEVLVLQLRRFIMDEATYAPRKLEADVAMPDVLDLEPLRAKGFQPTETVMPDSPPSKGTTKPAAATQKRPDPVTVATLESMGVPKVRAERASVMSGNIDQAMDWLFAHSDDPDIDTPLPAAPAAPSSMAVDGENVELLVGMGFTKTQASFALSQTGNSVERAADWLFSHTDMLDSLVVPTPSATSPAAPSSSSSVHRRTNQDPAVYDLFGFISHMGPSTQSGHYVAHILKKDANGRKWVLFNDNKVAISEEPPKHMGYLYFYRRRDTASKW
ncbi:ubiquitin carboxyl-terminal hydrolase 5 [Pelomyxa schiedti]|nr:ubiquitin carboxyl-terminal hydrolase 5 [Pelomyxa schiedti]